MLRINKNDLTRLAGPDILLELTSHRKYGSVIKFPDTFYVDISINSDRVLIEYFREKEVRVSFLTMDSKDKYFYVVMALFKALNPPEKYKQSSESEDEDSKTDDQE